MPDDKPPCQRWKDRRDSYRTDTAERFNPKRYTVERTAHGPAKEFTKRHHYAGSWPSVSRAYGLFQERGGFWSPELVGVCAFGIPAGPAVLKAHKADLELNRLVLLDSVPANAESWFVSRVFDDLSKDMAVPPLRRPWASTGPVATPTHGDALARALAALLAQGALPTLSLEHALKALGLAPTAQAYQDLSVALTALGYAPTRESSLRVLSFSDPLRRTTKDGRVVTPGHLGVVYQALSAEYKGQTKPRHVYLDSEGRTLAERSLSKIRNGEDGWEGAVQDLVSRDAPARRPGEAPSAWLARALASPAFRRDFHPGQYTYHWTWSGRSSRPDRVQGLPYPKFQPAGNTPEPACV